MGLVNNSISWATSTVKGLSFALAGYVFFLALDAWGVALDNKWVVTIAFLVSTATVLSAVFRKIGLGDMMNEMAAMVPAWIGLMMLTAWGVSMMHVVVVILMALCAVLTLLPNWRNIPAMVGIGFFVLLALYVGGLGFLGFVASKAVLTLVALVLVVAPWFMKSKPVGQD